MLHDHSPTAAVTFVKLGAKMERRKYVTQLGQDSLLANRYALKITMPTSKNLPARTELIKRTISITIMNSKVGAYPIIPNIPAHILSSQKLP